MKTILIIDDDINQRNLISNYLKKYGYNIVCCIDGQKGIDYIMQHYINIDFILLDYIMPNIDGISTLKILKKNINTQSIPIVMMSADDIEDYPIIKQCIFLKKPFREKDLQYLTTLFENTYNVNFL